MKTLSRDQQINQNSTTSDLLDYQYFLQSQNDLQSRIYIGRHKKALTALAIKVIKTELTPKQREIVILTKVRGFKNKDVAKMLGVNPSTVCRHLKQAQKKFDNAFEYYIRLKPLLINE